MSVDRKAKTWAEQTYLRAWVESIEACGFVFLRHAYLPRSHALAFATAPLGDDAALGAADGTGCSATREPPELRMRREDRGEWQ